MDRADIKTLPSRLVDNKRGPTNANSYATYHHHLIDDVGCNSERLVFVLDALPLLLLLLLTLLPSRNSGCGKTTSVASRNNPICTTRTKKIIPFSRKVSIHKINPPSIIAADKVRSWRLDNLFLLELIVVVVAVATAPPRIVSSRLLVGVEVSRVVLVVVIVVVVVAEEESTDCCVIISPALTFK